MRSKDPVKPGLQKVVIMADEFRPENDGRWIPFSGHGTTRMPLTDALTNCARRTSEQPLQKLITPYIAARE